MSDSTTEILIYCILCVHVAAALWFFCRMISPEFRALRERRRCPGSEVTETGTPEKLSPVIASSVHDWSVRGYDSPEVLRKDTLERIKQIERQIAANLRQMEERNKT